MARGANRRKKEKRRQPARQAGSRRTRRKMEI